MIIFRLTGKAKLGTSIDVNLNMEADVIARKGEEGLLEMDEDGSYIVPATDYDKIDLSIDVDMPLTEGIQYI